MAYAYHGVPSVRQPGGALGERHSMLESRAYRNYSTHKLSTKRIASGDEVVDKRTTKRPGMTWKDHLVMLLHNGAEIEHSLMVQYLFAAYTIASRCRSATGSWCGIGRKASSPSPRRRWGTC